MAAASLVLNGPVGRGEGSPEGRQSRYGSRASPWKVPALSEEPEGPT